MRIHLCIYVSPNFGLINSVSYCDESLLWFTRINSCCLMQPEANNWSTQRSTMWEMINEKVPGVARARGAFYSMHCRFFWVVKDKLIVFPCCRFLIGRDQTSEWLWMSLLMSWCLLPSWIMSHFYDNVLCYFSSFEWV